MMPPPQAPVLINKYSLASLQLDAQNCRLTAALYKWGAA